MAEVAINGRRITLDPIMDREPLTLPVRRVENSLPAGLRMGWMSGGEEDDPYEVDLACGAGFGSPWLILSIRHKDLGPIDEVVDMREVVNAWVKAAIEAGASPKVGQ